MNELQHHGVIGMRWGVRRYQNKDGSLTDLGHKRRHFGRSSASASNTIYKSLSDRQKNYVMGTDGTPPKKFTDYGELADYSVKTFTVYNKRKPVSSVTAWRDGSDAVALSVMTSANDLRKGYGSKAVKQAVDWLDRSNFKKVYWDVHIENSASIALAKKYGFEYVRSNKNDPVWAMYIKDLTPNKHPLL